MGGKKVRTEAERVERVEKEVLLAKERAVVPHHFIAVIICHLTSTVATISSSYASSTNAPYKSLSIVLALFRAHIELGSAVVTRITVSLPS